MKNRATSETIQMVFLFFGSMLVVWGISRLWQMVSKGLEAFPG